MPTQPFDPNRRRSDAEFAPITAARKRRADSEFAPVAAARKRFAESMGTHNDVADKSGSEEPAQPESKKSFVQRHRGLVAGALLGTVAAAGVGGYTLLHKKSKPGTELMAEYAAIPASEKDLGGGQMYPDYEARHDAVLEWINDGNITSSSEEFVTISVTGKNDTEVSYEIMIHELRVGNDESFYMATLDDPHSLAACKILGLELPTRWMAHELRRKVFKDGGKLGFIAYCDIKQSLGEPCEANERNWSLKNFGGRQGPLESETPKIIKGHGDLFMKLLAETQMKPDQPVSGHFKEVIQDPMHPKDKLATYRACEGKEPVPNWEKLPDFGCSLVADRHDTPFFDYSHGVRCAKPKMTVLEKPKDKEPEKQEMTIQEFYANKDYREKFGLVNLPLRVPAYEYPPALAKWMEEHGHKEVLEEGAAGGKSDKEKKK